MQQGAASRGRPDQVFDEDKPYHGRKALSAGLKEQRKDLCLRCCVLKAKGHWYRARIVFLAVVEIATAPELDAVFLDNIALLS